MHGFPVSLGRLSTLSGVLLLALGCDATEPQPEPSFSGTYSISWARTAADCTPASLPAAVGSDTTLYASVPMQTHSMPMSAVVVHSGTSVTLTPAASNGAPLTSLALAGQYVPPRTAILTRASTRSEGPRAGGKQFIATETVTDTASFATQGQTIPSVAPSFVGKGATTVVFRDAASGAIYTTCSFKDAILGLR
jgi:hypothetical protein